MNSDSSPTLESPDLEPSAPASAGAPIAREKPARRLSMSVVNFWLDATLLAAITAHGWLAVVLRFVFPAPSKAIGWSLWGWTFDQWWDFQFSMLCVFAVGALVHVMLHWNWVCLVVANQILGKKRPNDAMQTILGVGTLIVLLHLIAIGVIIAMATIVRPTP
jgi:hypothetical protein